MKPKDMFQLAVRILGLVFLYHGLTGLPLTLPAISSALFSGQLASFVFALFVTVWPLGISFWLLRGAPFLMRLAYSDTPSTLEPEGVGVYGHKADA